MAGGFQSEGQTWGRAGGLLKAGGALLRIVDLRGRGKLSLEPREFRLVLVLAVAEAEGSAIF